MGGDLLRKNKILPEHPLRLSPQVCRGTEVALASTKSPNSNHCTQGVCCANALKKVGVSDTRMVFYKRELLKPFSGWPKNKSLLPHQIDFFFFSLLWDSFISSPFLSNAEIFFFLVACRKHTERQLPLCMVLGLFLYHFLKLPLRRSSAGNKGYGGRARHGVSKFQPDCRAFVD